MSLDDATMLKLLDALSDLFQECLKNVEKHFLTVEDDSCVKVEEDLGYYLNQENLHSPGEIDV